MSFIDVRDSVIIICMVSVAVLIAWITWYPWIYTRNTNANFYFVIKLVLNVVQVS